MHASPTFSLAFQMMGTVMQDHINLKSLYGSRDMSPIQDILSRTMRTYRLKASKSKSRWCRSLFLRQSTQGALL